MRKSLLAMGAALAIGLSASAASAAEFLFQWDDGVEGHLFADTYKDGVLIQHADVGAESYKFTYGIWDGGVLADSFDVAFNIFDTTGTLSDTYHIIGTKGATRFQPLFSSDVEGVPLTFIDGGASITETGLYQTVFDFNTTAGDHYTLQFRSDAGGGVPEPATWTMMIGGFGLVGAMARRRKAAAPQTA